MMNATIDVPATLGRLLAAVVVICAATLFFSNSAQAGSCGADGERACCAGTFEVLLGNACDYGNVETPGCSGIDCTCGGFNPFGWVKASGTCKATTACGGEGQRACCNGWSESTPSGALRACESNLIPVEGCAGNCLCGGVNTVGDNSKHTCAKPTECGGEGQRACCVGEPGTTGACGSGLVETPGCTGDCSCATADPADWLGGLPSKSSGTCVREGYSNIAIQEPDTGWTEPSTPRSCGIKGYADLHNHLFGHLAHGGKAFAGESAPVNDDGEFALDETSNNITSALSSSKDLEIHGTHVFLGGLFGGDTVGSGTQDGSQGPGGSPYFHNWPTWTTTTHQQMYYKWVERAFRGGMRLTTMLAVTNEALCKTTEGSDCANSMGPIDDQIAAAYDFERFIDEQCQRDIANGDDSGFCVGDEGWFRIVTDPLQARQVISEGKLAVVLGIEVDNLFNCKEENANRPDATCPNMRDANGDLIVNDYGEPIETVAMAVDHYFDKGVRHFFPIHNFDNAFGGAATWQDIIAIGNAYSEKRWWEIENCGEEGYQSVLSGGPFDDIIKRLIGAIGFDGETPDRPYYQPTPACNRYGLNLGGSSPGPDKRGLGLELLEALMDRGMVIDIDHMSRKSLDNTLVLTRRYAGDEENVALQYPLVASHVQFFDLHQPYFGGNQGRHERMRTREQLEAIRDGGGMIAAMTKDDVQDTDLKGEKVTIAYRDPDFGAAISDNCRHSSKTFAQAYQYAVDVMVGPVALGSDFNGVAGHVGPRFGDDACGSDLPLSIEIEAANERSAQLREGNKLLYPFTLEGFGSFDKQQTGFKTFDFNVDGLAHVGLLPDLVKDMENIGLEQTYLDALLGSAEEYIRVWERAVRIAAVKNGEPMPESPPAGLSCPRPSLCQGEGNTPPQISCPEPVTKECEGSTTFAEFGSPVTEDGSCGAALVQGCTPTTGSGFTQGYNQVSCSVIDGARNTQSCDFSVTIQDTQLPEITAPDGITGEECTSYQGAAPDLGHATASDVCDAEPFVTNNAPAVFPLGTTDVEWLAKDDSGNSRSAIQKVGVVDTTMPEISAPDDLADIECTSPEGASPELGQARVTDICDAAPAVSNDAPSVLPLGINTVVWSVVDASDNGNSSNQLVEVVDTTPPLINCPAEIVEECTGNHSATVTPQAATGEDICSDSVVLTRPTTQSFALGVNQLTYTATDRQGLESSCNSNVVVQDTTPPAISAVTPSMRTLWPPNHEMVNVTVSVATSDICDNAVPICRVTSISSNEAVDGKGDGSTGADWQWDQGQRGTSLGVLLRAEREGSGSGRTYTIAVACQDEAGNETAAQTLVYAPKNNN